MRAGSATMERLAARMERGYGFTGAARLTSHQPNGPFAARWVGAARTARDAQDRRAPLFRDPYSASTESANARASIAASGLWGPCRITGLRGLQLKGCRDLPAGARGAENAIAPDLAFKYPCEGRAYVSLYRETDIRARGFRMSHGGDSDIRAIYIFG